MKAQAKTTRNSLNAICFLRMACNNESFLVAEFFATNNLALHVFVSWFTDNFRFPILGRAVVSRLLGRPQKSVLFLNNVTDYSDRNISSLSASNYK